MTAGSRQSSSNHRNRPESEIIVRRFCRVIAERICAKTGRISSDSAASRCQLTSPTGRSMTGGRKLKRVPGTAARPLFQDAPVFTFRWSEATPRSDWVNFFILDSDDVARASWFRKGNRGRGIKLKRGRQDSARDAGVSVRQFSDALAASSTIWPGPTPECELPSPVRNRKSSNRNSTGHVLHRQDFTRDSQQSRPWFSGGLQPACACGHRFPARPTRLPAQVLSDAGLGPSEFRIAPRITLATYRN